MTKSCFCINLKQIRTFYLKQGETMMRIDPNSKEAILAKKLDSYIFRQKEQINSRDEKSTPSYNFIWMLEVIRSALIHGTAERLPTLYLLTILDINFAKKELVQDFPEIAKEVVKQSAKLTQEISNLLSPK